MLIELVVDGLNPLDFGADLISQEALRRSI